MIEFLIHRCFTAFKPDLIAYCRMEENTDSFSVLKSRGYKPDRTVCRKDDESIQFMNESGQAVSILNLPENRSHPFEGILLNSRMKCGFALFAGEKGILFINFLHPYRFSLKDIQKAEEMIAYILSENMTVGGPGV